MEKDERMKCWGDVKHNWKIIDCLMSSAEKSSVTNSICWKKNLFVGWSSDSKKNKIAKNNINFVQWWRQLHDETS
jgi:hypothetical protein